VPVQTLVDTLVSNMASAREIAVYTTGNPGYSNVPVQSGAFSIDIWMLRATDTVDTHQLMTPYSMRPSMLNFPPAFVSLNGVDGRIARECGIVLPHPF
jgi:hypothetical protein